MSFPLRYLVYQQPHEFVQIHGWYLFWGLQAFAGVGHWLYLPPGQVLQSLQISCRHKAELCAGSQYNAGQECLENCPIGKLKSL
jgi:hypothetical protein